MFNNRMSRILLTGSLLIRFSMLIIAAGLLVATLASPAGASAATVTTGQVPAPDPQIASRQAHSIMPAAKQEAGMQATVKCLVSTRGSTATLVSIPEDYRCTAGGDLRNLIESVCAAGEITPHKNALRDRYWLVKMTAALDAFDLRAGVMQKIIRTLEEDGYDIATAQETLDEIAAMRSELSSALSSEDYSSFDSANQKIHAAFVNLSRIITDLQHDVTTAAPGFVGSLAEVP